MQVKYFEDLKVGQKATFSKTITETDVCGFAGITGDMNPIHINKEFASTTRFGQRIAHGILSVGLISNVMGTQIPGPGSAYMSQTARFLKPVFFGDTITASVEVMEKIEGKNRVRMRTWCTNQRGETVIDGESLMWVPRRPE